MDWKIIRDKILADQPKQIFAPEKAEVVHHQVKDEDYEWIDTSELVPDDMFSTIAYMKQLNINSESSERIFDYRPSEQTIHTGMSEDQILAITGCWVYETVKYATPLTKSILKHKWSKKMLDYIKFKEEEYDKR